MIRDNSPQQAGRQEPQISSLELMNALVVDVFGTITIKRSLWHANSENFPARTYFFERRKRNRDKPINETCARYIVVLYELALTTKTDFSSVDISRKLDILLRRYLGPDLPFGRIVQGDARDVAINKAALQLRCLAALLDSTRDKQFTDMVELRQRYSLVVSEAREEKEDDIGADDNPAISFFYDSVNEAGFSGRIVQVKHEMDVAFFSGALWTKTHLKQLRERFAYGNISVRVILASENSPFFEPYANLKQPTSSSDKGDADKPMDVALTSIGETVQIWEKLYKAADKNGAKNIDMSIYKHDQVPAQAFYRFDDSIIMAPTKSSSRRRFPAFECRKSGMRNDAYSALIQEIDALATEENVFSSYSNTREGTQRHNYTVNLLIDLLAGCFGSIRIGYKSWTMPEGTGLPPKEYYATRVKQHSSAPIDEPTANYLVAMFRLVLEDKTPYGSEQMSLNLAGFINNLLGVKLKRCVLAAGDTEIDRLVKRNNLLVALRYILEATVDRETFEPELALELLHAANLA